MAHDKGLALLINWPRHSTQVPQDRSTSLGLQHKVLVTPPNNADAVCLKQGAKQFINAFLRLHNISVAWNTFQMQCNTVHIRQTDKLWHTLKSVKSNKNKTYNYFKILCLWIDTYSKVKLIYMSSECNSPVGLYSVMNTG